MEILVVTWNYPPRRGGMESLLKDLCQALRKRHSVSVVTSYAGSNGSVEAEEKVYRPRWPGLAVFSLYALFRGALLLHRRKKIELIFGGSAMVAPLVLLLARLFGRKAIVQVHGLDLIYPSSSASDGSNTATGSLPTAATLLSWRNKGVSLEILSR
jgi:phosphatidyl-myo-inositol dimannoside synthase